MSTFVFCPKNLQILQLFFVYSEGTLSLIAPYPIKEYYVFVGPLRNGTVSNMKKKDVRSSLDINEIHHAQICCLPAPLYRIRSLIRH